MSILIIIIIIRWKIKPKISFFIFLKEVKNKVILTNANTYTVWYCNGSYIKMICAILIIIFISKYLLYHTRQFDWNTFDDSDNSKRSYTNTRYTQTSYDGIILCHDAKTDEFKSVSNK